VHLLLSMVAPNLCSAPKGMKLDKIFTILCRILNACKSMPPLGTLDSYRHTHTLEIVLLLHRGLGFLALRAFTYCYLFSAFYFIANYTPKTPKLLHFFYCLLVKSSNQYLQLLVGSQPFLLKITRIDLMHLEAINCLYL
jgi:hypothetical protein